MGYGLNAVAELKQILLERLLLQLAHMQLRLHIHALLVHLADVDALVSLLVVYDLEALAFVSLAQAIEFSLERLISLLHLVGALTLLGEFAIKLTVLCRHLVAFFLELLQLGLAVLYILVRLNVVQFELLVELLILMRHDDEFARRIGKQLLKVFNLTRCRLLEFLDLRFILLFDHVHLVLIHFLHFVAFVLLSGRLCLLDLLRPRHVGSQLLQLFVRLRRIVVIVRVGTRLFIYDRLQEVDSFEQLLVQ